MSDFIEPLREAGRARSEAHRMLCEAKSLRQPDNPERRTDLYSFCKPEGTLEWKAANRIAALDGPDRVTDVEIQLALYGDKPFGVVGNWPHIRAGTLSGYLNAYRSVINSDDAIDEDSVLRFTASMDAAMTLVPEDNLWRLGHNGAGRDVAMFMAEVFTGDDYIKTFAETPALALCAAALKARGL